MIRGKSMKHKHWFTLGILALILVMGFSGCIGQFEPETTPEEYTTEEFRNTYEVESGTKLEVDNINGAITVTSWDNDQVEVYALMKTQYGQSELDKVSIEVSTGTKIVVKTKHPTLGTARVSVEYEIKVPAEVTVERLETTNGVIVLKGTTGDTTLHSSNGGITVKDVDGSVKASTSNGFIEIEDTTGVREVTTSNGWVKVEIPALSNDLDIATTNGAVTAYVAADLDADVVMSTTNGKVSVHDIQLTIKESSATRLEGTLGDGGYDLTIETSNGNIDLYKL